MKFNPAASIATRNANKASRRELLIKGVLLMACYFLFKFIYSKHGHQLQEFTPPSQTISIATTVGHPVPDPQLWKRPLGNNLALLSVVDHTPALKGQSLKVAMENIHMFAKSHPLFELVIPSLVATAEREMTYSLYFGYTYEDPLFDDDQARKSMINILESIIPKHTSNIIVKFLPLYSLPNEVSRLNYLADKAFRDNADYFLHIGQATRFLTDKWASIMTKELATNEIAPGFGVALLRHRGETHRPRFPMVSKRHIELMNGVYLPLPFEGGVNDGWLHGLYKPWGSAFEDLPVEASDGLLLVETAQRPADTKALYASLGISKTAFARQMTKTRKRLNYVLKSAYPDISVNMHFVHSFDGCLWTDEACERERQKALGLA